MAAAPWLIGGGLALGAGALAANRFVAGAAQNRTTMGTLGNLSFANMGAATGRGFDYRQLQGITDVMREVDKADPFTSMSDLNQTLRAFTDIGMAQGVQDAQEFGRRFKKMSESVRDIARAMGSTMEDATTVFSSMRQAGFVSGSDVIANTRQMQVLGGMGMSRDQFFGAQEQGAGFSRSQSLSGVAGARQVSGTAMRLLTDVERGRITGERLMDITGAATADAAAAALGQDTLQAQMTFLTGEAGEAFMAAFGSQDDQGRFTGGIDRGRAREFLEGGGGVGDLSALAAQRFGSWKESRTSFVHHRRDIASAFLEQDDSLRDILQMIQQSDRLTGGDDNMVGILTERLLGIDHLRADLIQELLDTWEENTREQTELVTREVTAAAMQRERAERGSLAGWKRAIKGVYEDAMHPIDRIGDTATTTMDVIGQALYNSVMGFNPTGVGEAQLDIGLRQAVQGQAVPTGLTRQDVAAQILEEHLLISEKGTPELFAEHLARSRSDLDLETKRLRSDPRIQELLDTAISDPSTATVEDLRSGILQELGGVPVAPDKVAQMAELENWDPAVIYDVSYVLSGLRGGERLSAIQPQGYRGSTTAHRRNAFYGQSRSRAEFYRYGLQSGDLALLSQLEGAGVSFDADSYQLLARKKASAGVIGEDAILASIADDMAEKGISVDSSALKRILGASRQMGSSFQGFKARAAEGLARDAQVAAAAGSVYGFAQSGLLGTDLGDELGELRIAAATGGDLGAAYRAVLEAPADLGGLDTPLAQSVASQRKRYRRLPAVGTVSQAQLSSALGMDADEMNELLGQSLVTAEASGGGISPEEAKDLFAAASVESTMRTAAAGGSEMMFRSMFDRIATINDSIDKTNESVGILHQQISASTPVAGTDVTPDNELE